FENRFNSTAIKVPNQQNGDMDYTNYNYDILSLKTIVIMGYSLLFFGILSLFNIQKIKNKTLGITAIIFTLISLLAAETGGLFVLGELREAYIGSNLNEYYQIGFGYVLIR